VVIACFYQGKMAERRSTDENGHHAAPRSIFQCGPATAGSARQSNQPQGSRAELASHTNHAWQVLLGAREPCQPWRCIIGKRRELTQIRIGEWARKNGSRAVPSKKFVRSARRDGNCFGFSSRI
jgi:hypothetical protein